MLKLVPNSYILDYHGINSGYEIVTLRAVSFDSTGIPTSWAVKSWPNYSMSKKTGRFQELPRSIYQEIRDEYQFNTPEEAIDCWNIYELAHRGGVNSHFDKNFTSR